MVPTESAATLATCENEQSQKDLLAAKKKAEDELAAEKVMAEEERIRLINEKVEQDKIE